MTELLIGGLFEGYGGLTMGVQLALGGELAWYSEIEEAACNLLAERHPGVPNLGDITLVNWQSVQRVHVLCGGFPCQDLSTAGRQDGLTTESRSGLWWRFADAIKHLRPKLVVIENVRGLLTARGADPTEELLAAWAELDGCDRILTLIESKHRRAVQEGKPFYVQQHATDRLRFMAKRKRAVVAVRRADARIVRAIGAVLGALADLGYDAQWHGLRAAEVGAPHGRFRIFIVAERATSDAGSGGRDGRQESERNWWPSAVGQQAGGQPCDAGGLPAADAERGGCDGGTCQPERSAVCGTPSARCGPVTRADVFAGRWCACEPLADTHGQRLPAGRHDTRRPEVRVAQWGQFEPAIRRWEAILGRVAPPPTEPNSTGGQRLSPRFVEWMMGLPLGHVTDPALGLTRNEQLKMLGNGVVPQQAAEAIRVCLGRAVALGGAA